VELGHGERGTRPAQPLVIIGAGGFGREVLDVLEDVVEATGAFEVLGFLDDGVVAGDRLDRLARLGVRVLGGSDRIPAGAAHVVAIADPAARRRVATRADGMGSPSATVVHPAATISRHAILGPGCIIAAGARISTNVTLGCHVHVNVNSAIGHDSRLDDYVTLFGNVQVGGGVVVEAGATLGSGCTILPGVTIGAGAYVGAGATVVRDVEPGATVVTPGARPTLGAQRDRLAD
jgi:sugar O-acyltransferase (sialic acid O-acetyltransferase NeuD family)